jgi:hypothetical protein
MELAEGLDGKTVAFLCVLLVVSLCDLFFPRQMWALWNSWQFKNSEDVEPSDIVIFIRRAMGLVFSSGIIYLFFLAIFVWPPIEARGERCAKLFPELVDAVHGSRGLDWPLSQEDKDSIVRTINRRGNGLSLKVIIREARSVYEPTKVEITERGSPFAWIGIYRDFASGDCYARKDGPHPFSPFRALAVFEPARNI